jgi:hypothetical protein
MTEFALTGPAYLTSSRHLSIRRPYNAERMFIVHRVPSTNPQVATHIPQSTRIGFMHESFLKGNVCWNGSNSNEFLQCILRAFPLITRTNYHRPTASQEYRAFAETNAHVGIFGLQTKLAL